LSEKLEFGSVNFTGFNLINKSNLQKLPLIFKLVYFFSMIHASKFIQYFKWLHGFAHRLFSNT